MPEADVLPEEATLGTALGLAARDGLVETFGLGPLLDARATEVSRGEAKRAQLCAALRLGRPIALLDEPFAAFDPLQLRRLLPQFRAAVRGAGVLVTVHQMRTAELVADRLLLLCEGRAIACGTPEELRRRAGAESAALDEVFLRLLDQEEGRALP
jgi:ABC-type multidrug transport system ATPase subunit